MLNENEKKFIKENLKENVNSLLLKYHNKEDLNYKFLIQQILARQKVKKKLPSLCENENIIFPPSLNLEQSSSEITAKYKRDIVKNMLTTFNSGVDLTAGLGIDSIFISDNFKEYHHIEPNKDLLSISESNYTTLGKSSVKLHNTTAEEFIKENKEENFDFIYIDPSRRDDKSGEKVVLLEDYSPNIIELEDDLLNMSDIVIVKTSPILDFNDSIKKLKNVSEVHIVSVKNEVKEVLYILKKDKVDDIKFITVNFKNSKECDTLTFTYDDIKNSTATFAEPKKYLYEPNSSIMKSLAFNFISQEFKIYKLHQNSHLYTSYKLIENFPGRVFLIEEAISGKPKSLKRFKKAHVACRNYPMTVEKIRKKAGLKDGGYYFIFATTLLDEKNIFLVCKKA